MDFKERLCLFKNTTITYFIILCLVICEALNFSFKNVLQEQVAFIYFKNININNERDLNFLIENLKNLFEDTWKKLNEINTSIKVPISIKIKNDDLKKSNNFELFLNEIDMVSDYSVEKFDKEFIFYEVLFNGTVKNFINIMKNKKYNLNTQKKVWMIE